MKVVSKLQFIARKHELEYFLIVLVSRAVVQNRTYEKVNLLRFRDFLRLVIFFSQEICKKRYLLGKNESPPFLLTIRIRDQI